MIGFTYYLNVQGRGVGSYNAAAKSERAGGAVHEPHVPDNGALAHQAELHALLEGESHSDESKLY